MNETSDEVFEFLKIKNAQFENNIHKDCVIVLDEMSITPSDNYDPSTGDRTG